MLETQLDHHDGETTDSQPKSSENEKVEQQTTELQYYSDGSGTKQVSNQGVPNTLTDTEKEETLKDDSLQPAAATAKKRGRPTKKKKAVETNPNSL